MEEPRGALRIAPWTAAAWAVSWPSPALPF